MILIKKVVVVIFLLSLSFSALAQYPKIAIRDIKTIHLKNKIKVEWSAEGLFEDVLGQRLYDRYEVHRIGNDGTNTILQNNGIIHEGYANTTEYKKNFVDATIINGVKYVYIIKYIGNRIFNPFIGFPSDIPNEIDYSKSVMAWRVPEPSKQFDFPNNDISYRCEVTYLYAYSNTSGGLVNPFIVVDGFDPSNLRNYGSATEANTLDTRGFYHHMNGNIRVGFSGEGGSGQNFVEKLRCSGRDVVLVDWEQGAGDIIQNGKLFIELINYINATKLVPENKLVIVGPSMGGMISRYALAKMETDGIDHQTSLWISMDSPHQGANIPLGFQHLVDHLYSNIPIAKLERGFEKLNSMAAKQLLLYHFSETEKNAVKGRPSSERKIMMDAIYALKNNGWPMNLRRIAISSGGGFDIFPTGEKLLDLTVLAPVIPPLPPVGIDLMERSLGHSSNRIMFITCNALPGINKIIDLEESPIALDNVTGGTLEIPKQFQDMISDLEIVNSNQGLLPSTTCFIPMSSAFGYRVSTADNAINQELTAEDFRKPWTSIETTYLFPDPSETPFHKIKREIKNEEHVQITQSTVEWIMEEIDGNVTGTDLIYPSGSSIVLNQNKNIFGKNVNIGNPDPVISLQINSGVTFNVKATESIKVSADFTAKQGSNVTLKIGEFDYNQDCLKPNGGRKKSMLSDEEFKNLYESFSNDERSKVLRDSANVLNKGMVIFPNPNDGNFTIVLQSESNDLFNLEVFDLQTKSLYNQLLDVKNGNITRVSLNFLESGTYFLKVSNGEEMYTEKFVKN